ncbi:MAG: glycosyltransferase family 4 protein [Calditrichaeota bacterium]|nr:glycosyltransferase family 4 protein [Calditrichota bacterium]
MKKVLIVTYYWPPAGGPGVQRILKFVKYLPEFGWQPLVLTVTSGEYPALDPSLEKEVPPECRVYRIRHLEPGHVFRKFVGMPADSRIQVGVLAEKPENWKKRLAFWIRANLFIPDAKIGWWPFAVREGMRIIRRERPQLIFSTSPPPTVHLIARTLSRRSGLQWVADFRDPWTDIHYYERQKRLPVARALDGWLEQRVLREADRLTFVSRLDIEQSFAQKVDPSKCQYLPNGYDEADFQAIPQSPADAHRFVLMHVGAVGIERNPVQLFGVLRDWLAEGFITAENFRLVFVGQVAESVRQSIADAGIEPLVEWVPYVPHHQALQQAAGATALLLLITQSRQNRRILPGKTFEYIRLQKPILALGPPGGEVDRILQELRMGRVLDYEDRAAIRQTLQGWIIQWKQGTLAVSGDGAAIQKFSRRSLTRQLADMFNQLVST